MRIDLSTGGDRRDHLWRCSDGPLGLVAALRMFAVLGALGAPSTHVLLRSRAWASMRPRAPWLRPRNHRRSCAVRLHAAVAAACALMVRLTAHVDACGSSHATARREESEQSLSSSHRMRSPETFAVPQRRRRGCASRTPSSILEFNSIYMHIALGY